MKYYKIKGKKAFEERQKQGNLCLKEFLEKFCELDKDGVILSSDIEKEFQEYMSTNKLFKSKWIISRVLFFYDSVERCTITIIENGDTKRRRGLSGIKFKDKEIIEKILDDEFNEYVKKPGIEKENKR